MLGMTQQPRRPGQRSSRSNTPLLVGTLLVAGAALAAVLLLPGRGALAPAVEGGRVDVSGQPTIGNAQAPVQLVVFEDFLCAACRNFDATIAPQLKREFVDGGQASYTFVNFPFLADDSYTAAQAAECVFDAHGAEVMNEYASTVYRGTREGTGWATPEYLTELGSFVSGVDTAALRECLSSGAQAASVEADKALGERLGVRGTPSVWVNGENVPSSYDDIAAAIRAAL